MLSQTITETQLGAGQISYELGKPNWEARVIPDIRRPGRTTVVDEQRMIDVIILGDGFTGAAAFREVLEKWIADFYAIEPYSVFAGCLRVRALYTPSTETASERRRSYYRTLVKDDGDALDKGTEWWASPDADGMAFRWSLWAGVDRFLNVNLRRYSLDLDVGDANQAITNTMLRDLYRNLVVCMLVNTSQTRHPSGFVGQVARPWPDTTRHVRVAFGANEIHEFGHAFGLLSDEYIKDNGRDTVNKRVNPAVRSVFSLSNLSYSTYLPWPAGAPRPTLSDVPWSHLFPEARNADPGPPPPLVGRLWVGGSVHLGVWHSEYRCLMNGTHDNFAFTQVDSADPTYTDKEAGDLRDRERLCLWCQELVALRILEKTYQLWEAGDPADHTSQGLTWYARWRDSLRAFYYLLFGVPGQLAAQDARYAKMTPGRNGEPLWRSDLYRAP